MKISAVIVVVAIAAASAGWASGLKRAAPLPPSIRIVDVRPLETSDPALRDLITHTAKVRVAITEWRLLPYLPGAKASDNQHGAGHWRLYLDGHSLGDNYGSATVSYTTYLVPGTHWIAAELTDLDHTSLDPPIWSEPIVLRVPRMIRCWQTGWQASPQTGAPTLSCNPAGV